MADATMTATSSSSKVSSHEPSLSRRVKSCEACRKMKVKCVFESDPPDLQGRCTRCIARGLQCHLSSNLQTVLENDLVWKARLQDQLESQQQQIDSQQQQIDRFNEALHGLTRHIFPSSVINLDGLEPSLTSRNKRPRLQAPVHVSPSASGHPASNPDRQPRTSRSQSEKEGEADEDESEDKTTLQSDLDEGDDDNECDPHQSISRRLQRDGHASVTSTRLTHFTSKHRRSDRTSQREGSSTPMATGPDSVLPIRANNQKQTDPISRSLLPLSTARHLFRFYLVHLDPQIYCLIRVCHYTHPDRGPDKQLSQHASDAWLDELRSSSTLLLLAVLSVAALHSKAVRVDAAKSSSNSNGQGSTSVSGLGRPFQLLYREFVRLAAMLSFSRQLTLDDIRALVIGAMWLPDISWILVGTAVRVATERGLHLSYNKLPSSSNRGSPVVAMTPTNAALPGSSSVASTPLPAVAETQQVWYQEARLYYVIYLVDHHAAIPHGRPPMTRQHSVIRHASEWLSRCSCNTLIGLRSPDQRLISHTRLWEIMHDLIDLAGTDVNKPLDADSVELNSNFESQLKRWLDETLFRTSLLFSGKEVDSELDQVKVVHSFAYLFLTSSAFRTPVGALPDFIALSTASSPSSTAQQLILRKRHMAERAMATSLTLIGALNSSGQPDNPKLHGAALRFAPAWMYSMLVSSLVFAVKVHEMLDANHCPHLLQDCSSDKTIDALTAAVRELESVAESVSEHHIVRKILDGAKALVRQMETIKRNEQSRDFMAAEPESSFSAAQPPDGMAQFDLLSDFHQISGLDFWPEIAMDGAAAGTGDDMPTGIDAYLATIFNAG